MRAFALALVLLFSTPALAAPICFNRAGDAVHCEVKGAMPLGWQLPPDEAVRREMNQPHPTASAILKVAAGLLLFFALIALLPEFDGARDHDWDSQEKQDPD
jgi:hypothetical protein